MRGFKLGRGGVLMVVLTGCPGGDTGPKPGNFGPTLSVTSPTSGAEFSLGQDITFVATVEDDHDDIASLEYQWTYDANVVLVGTSGYTEDGVTFTVAGGLPADGPRVTRTVTLTATDSYGIDGADSVEVVIIDNSAPSIQFLSPDEGEALSERDRIDVDLLVADDEGADLNTISLTWSGDTTSGAPANPTSDGHAKYSIEPQPAGDYSIEVLATDINGSTASAAVHFTVVPVDADGDGADAEAYGGDDCDDADATVRPGATEVCDGVDQDCDGVPDDEATDALVWYRDADADAYGGSTTTEACDPPAGYVANHADCDDRDASINPEGVELCDGEDNDCDGRVDLDSAADAPTWFGDVDGDGYGDGSGAPACEAPVGWVSADGDCDDADPAVHPAATEVCNGLDDNCDSHADVLAVDALPWFEDNDADGFGGALSGFACDPMSGTAGEDGDCDDADPAVNPDAVEVCDTVDNNCDGSTDGADAAGQGTWYADLDRDGFGGSATTTACSAPAGYVSDADDCDDGAASVHPGASDAACDGVDGDCSGSDAVRAVVCCDDADGDGWGAVGTEGEGSCACGDDEVEAVDGECLDCDDADAAVSPDAVEVRGDDVDNDCTCNDIDLPAGWLSLDAGATTGAIPAVVAEEAHDVGVQLIAPGVDLTGDGLVDVLAVARGRAGGTVYIGDPSRMDAAGTTDVGILGAVELTGATDGDYFGANVAVAAAGGARWLVVVSALETVGGVEDAGCVYFLQAPVPDPWAFDPLRDWRLCSTESESLAAGGIAVADFDGDGNDEVAVGAALEGRGVVHVIPGSELAADRVGDDEISAVGVTWEGTEDGGYGLSLAVGDVYSDITPDLVVGEYPIEARSAGAGATWVIDGARVLDGGTDAGQVRLGPDAACGDSGEQYGFGSRVLVADVDDDGVAELLIGARDAGCDGASFGGAVYVVPRGTVLGKTTRLDTTNSLEIRGDAGDRLGGDLAVAVDGRGTSLVLGAYSATGGASPTANSGVACTIAPGARWPATGSTTCVGLSATRMHGATEDQYCGYWVSAGDFDGDCLTDVAVSCVGDDLGGTDAGAAYLVPGSYGI